MEDGTFDMEPFFEIDAQPTSIMSTARRHSFKASTNAFAKNQSQDLFGTSHTSSSHSSFGPISASLPSNNYLSGRSRRASMDPRIFEARSSKPGTDSILSPQSLSANPNSVPGYLPLSAGLPTSPSSAYPNEPFSLNEATSPRENMYMNNYRPQQPHEEGNYMMHPQHHPGYPPLPPPSQEMMMQHQLSHHPQHMPFQHHFHPHQQHHLQQQHYQVDPHQGPPHPHLPPPHGSHPLHPNHMEPHHQQQFLGHQMGQPPRPVGGTRAPIDENQPMPSHPAQRPSFERKRSVTSDPITHEPLSPQPGGERRSSTTEIYLQQPTGKIDREMKKMSLYKTELCRSWEETGTCRYGTKCQFAHSMQELRHVDRHPKYKTEMCKTFWDKGTCPYGKRCCFIHTERDVDKQMTDSQQMALIRSGSEDQQQENAPPLKIQTSNNRARAMSVGNDATLAASDALPSSSIPSAHAVSASAYSRASKSASSPQSASLYDHHRALAEAYFSGLQEADTPPMADGYLSSADAVQDDSEVEQINQMLRNVGLSGNVSDEFESENFPALIEPQRVVKRSAATRRFSLVTESYSDQNHRPFGDFLSPTHPYQPNASESLVYPHSAPSVAPNFLHTYGMRAANLQDRGDGRQHKPATDSQIVGPAPGREGPSAEASMATPPRERTRRARSVTQPSTILLPGQISWGKGRSESFSGHLPGNDGDLQSADSANGAVDADDSTNHYINSRGMPSANGLSNRSGSKSINVPYNGQRPGYPRGHSYGSQQSHNHPQLLSPPPSRHPSPVREAIFEEDDELFAMGDAVDIQESHSLRSRRESMSDWPNAVAPESKRRLSLSVKGSPTANGGGGDAAHRLPFFKNIKDVVL